MNKTFYDVHRKSSTFSGTDSIIGFRALINYLKHFEAHKDTCKYTFTITPRYDLDAYEQNEYKRLKKKYGGLL